MTDFGFEDSDEEFPTLEEELSLVQQVEQLKDMNTRLLRKMEREKKTKRDYVDAIKMAVDDNLALMTLKPVKATKFSGGPGTEETAVAVLSDWQLAKVTPSYNTQVCEERIEIYGDKLLKIVSMQRKDHPVKILRVWILGDIVEGELIFPGQSFLIDSSLYRQVTLDGPRILCNFLRKMLANFDEVHVVGVIGNHGAIGGRSRRDMNPETNADRMLYQICRQILEKEERLHWNIPDGDSERNWYAVDKVGAKSFLLAHGDQVRGGFGGFPFYGLAKKTWGWATGAVPEHFDEVLIGHWHQPTRVTLNRITARVNGSTESTNTYAMEQLAAVGRPSQWLLFVHPETGVSGEYCVWLDT